MDEPRRQTGSRKFIRLFTGATLLRAGSQSTNIHAQFHNAQQRLDRHSYRQLCAAAGCEVEQGWWTIGGFQINEFSIALLTVTIPFFLVLEPVNFLPQLPTLSRGAAKGDHDARFVAFSAFGNQHTRSPGFL